MNKASTSGYILTFLMGVGAAALAAYIYVSITAVPPAMHSDLPTESAGTAEDGALKSKAQVIPREKPGDRSYLPAANQKKEKEKVSEPGNPANAPAGSNATGADATRSAAAMSNRELSPKGTGKEFSLFLKQEDVNQLLDVQLSGKGDNGVLPAGAVKNARLAINGKELGLYAHLNLDEIARATAKEEDRQKLEAVKKYLPFVDTKNLDVEIHGNFSVRKGMLMIDPDAQVKIASLNMRLSTLHGLLLSGNPLPAEIPLQSVQGIQIDELTVSNNGIQVTGKHSPE